MFCVRWWKLLCWGGGRCFSSCLTTPPPLTCMGSATWVDRFLSAVINYYWDLHCHRTRICLILLFMYLLYFVCTVVRARSIQSFLILSTILIKFNWLFICYQTVVPSELLLRWIPEQCGGCGGVLSSSRTNCVVSSFRFLSPWLHKEYVVLPEKACSSDKYSVTDTAILQLAAISTSTLCW